MTNGELAKELSQYPLTDIATWIVGFWTLQQSVKQINRLKLKYRLSYTTYYIKSAQITEKGAA